MTTFQTSIEDGRVRRSRETRARLVEATKSLLGEGNWRPTARDIAKRGGVSQRTVFAHFGTLNELMLEAAARHAAQKSAPPGGHRASLPAVRF